jgi:hypothetical protein
LKSATQTKAAILVMVVKPKEAKNMPMAHTKTVVGILLLSSSTAPAGREEA